MISCQYNILLDSMQYIYIKYINIYVMYIYIYIYIQVENKENTSYSFQKILKLIHNVKLQIKIMKTLMLHI